MIKSIITVSLAALFLWSFTNDDEVNLDNVTANRSTTGAAARESNSFEIEALRGQRLNFATMMISSNDWFISNNEVVTEIFNKDGTSKTSFDITKNYLYNAQTEIYQVVGLGAGQPMRSSAAVADNTNTTVNRTIELNNIQYGKGLITSAAGVTQTQRSQRWV